MGVYFVSFNLMQNSTADYFIALCNRLSEVGKVVVVSGKVRETNIQLNSNIDVLQWPTPRATYFKDFIFIIKAIREYKPDTIIAIFGFVNLSLIAGKILGVKNRIAWIRSMSAQFSHHQFNIIRRSFVYGLATCIVTNSKATKADASKFYNIKPSKIVVLPNSVKDYNSIINHVNVDITNILYVGRLHKTKGVDILISAFDILIKDGFNLELNIIGNGPIHGELKQLVEEKEISAHVHFLGIKQKEEVLHYYKKSYITVVPSYVEAFGFTVIEAMSVGTCVIGANNSGIMEIIDDGKTGLLFKTGDDLDLSKKLKMLVCDINLRNNLGAYGYAKFLKYYESQVAVDRDFDFFKHL